MAELCSHCKEREHTILCDFPDNPIITSGNKFEPMYRTCDAKLCEVCAVNILHGYDYCPNHANQMWKRLNEEKMRRNNR